MFLMFFAVAIQTSSTGLNPLNQVYVFNITDCEGAFADDLGWFVLIP